MAFICRRQLRAAVFHAVIRRHDQPIGRHLIERAVDARGDHLRGLNRHVGKIDDAEHDGLRRQLPQDFEIKPGLGGLDGYLLHLGLFQFR